MSEKEIIGYGVVFVVFVVVASVGSAIKDQMKKGKELSECLWELVIPLTNIGYGWTIFWIFVIGFIMLVILLNMDNR